MIKKHIAFFISNRTYSDVDCRRIVDGNPGIGGTEYMNLLISYLLTIRDNGIEVIVYTTAAGLLPVELHTEVVPDLKYAVLDADKKECDFLIFNCDTQNISLVEGMELQYTKFIVWCHNFASRFLLDTIASDNRIWKIITVGREQKDIYRDHPVFYKTEYIYNCINVGIGDKYCVSSYPIKDRRNIVTYLGVISKYKGFHCLAEAWPKVVSAIPDAQLYVIGAGNLYDRNMKLGKWGIADEEYEDYFMPFLSKNGNVLDSVHFLGIMGEEKNEILLQTKVGVPGIGVPETFGLVTLEMQVMGCSIVAKECAGYLDTVLSGKLIKSRNDLTKSIIQELRNPHNNYRETIEAIRGRFSPDAVIKDWEELLLKGHIIRDNSMMNSHFRMKFLKEWIRIIKRKFSWFEFIPTVEAFYSYFFWKTLRLRKRNRFDCADLY